MSASSLDPIAQDLWGAQFDLFMARLVHFRGRMTVVRLANGGLLLHSVVPITDEIARALDALGPVEHIVAPNLVHHLHIPSATARYPKAQLWGARGLDKKRQDLTFHATLGVDPTPWSSELHAVELDGVPALNETVFLHRPTRTLIVTDLVFNIHRVQGWLTRGLLGMVGAYRQLAQSRLLRLLTKDRAAAAASVSQILDLDFDRLVMAHGEIVDTDAKGQLAGALAWMKGS